ncbi:hypothetical protein GCM10009740_06620 [Terrabacter terrae]|uniref:DUF5667 domain-containing protein n=1 Tax=Terrabacter terrae TaxID=318434 RepID=A0ABP5F9H9_9MICO
MTETRARADRHGTGGLGRLVLSGVAVCALAACTQGAGAVTPASTPPVTSPTSASAAPASSTTTTPSKTPTSRVATGAPAPEVGKALAAAIDDLSTKKRNLVRLDAARKQLQVGNDALRQARTSVTSIRSAVYGTTRNCTAGWAQNSIVRSRSSAAVGNANAVMKAVSSRRGQLAVLAAAATNVERQVAAQRSTLTSMPNVRAAVFAARSTVAAESSATNKVNESAVALRNNAIQVSAGAAQIMAKTC